MKRFPFINIIAVTLIYLTSIQFNVSSLNVSRLTIYFNSYNMSWSKYFTSRTATDWLIVLCVFYLFTWLMSYAVLLINISFYTTAASVMPVWKAGRPHRTSACNIFSEYTSREIQLTWALNLLWHEIDQTIKSVSIETVYVFFPSIQWARFQSLPIDNTRAIQATGLKALPSELRS